jgi:hypothetical protein
LLIRIARRREGWARINIETARHHQQEIPSVPRVVRFHEKGAPEVLKIEDIAVPPPGPGEITVEIKAIGLNRAESMFRSGVHGGTGIPSPPWL